MNLVDKFFEELSWEDVQRERRLIRTGSVFCFSAAVDVSQPRRLVTFQLIRFCYQGIHTYSVFPCFFFVVVVVAESDVFVPKLGFVYL